MQRGRPAGSREGAGRQYFHTGYDLFDYDRFMADVRKALARDGITAAELCREYGLAKGTLNPEHNGTRRAFRTVCFFASFCDISLDSYLTDVTAVTTAEFADRRIPA